jgi:hypothetical protein
MVDGSGGCDGVEQLIYGGSLVSMRVVYRPIHRWWGGQGSPVCLHRQGWMMRGVRWEAGL